MATYPSILAWRILWTEEPGGLQSTGSQRVTTEQLTHTQGKNPRQRPIAFRLFREPEETFDGRDGSRAKKGPDGMRKAGPGVPTPLTPALTYAYPLNKVVVLL